MPPVTRRSTGSVAKIKYYDFSSESDEGVSDKPKSKVASGRKKRGEESDFELSAANESSSESAGSSEDLTVDEGEEYKEEEDDEEEVVQMRISKPNASWISVKKLPLFPATLLSSEASEIISDSLSYLERIDGWRAEVKNLLTDLFPGSEISSGSKVDPFILNAVLGYLNKNEIPAVHLFIHSSFRGIDPISTKKYFSHLQELARIILGML
jgi:hypothetical protein